MLTDVHNGKISPLSLSACQLKAELTPTKAHLLTLHLVPTEDGILIQIYKLTNVYVAVIKNEVILKFKLLPVAQQFFDVFEVVLVETAKVDTLITVTPKKYLAINAHPDEYCSFTIENITNCVVRKDGVYVRKNKLSKFRENSDINGCEISLSNNRTTSSYKFAQILGKAVWTPLNQQSKWTFGTALNTGMSKIYCTETTLMALKGTGVIEIESKCLIKNSFITTFALFWSIEQLAYFIRKIQTH